MSNGSFDYTKLTEKQILLLVVQRLDGLEGLPRRVASLERKWAWLTGIGSAFSALIAFLEARRHG